MHAGTGGASLKPRRTSSFDSAASGGFRCECVLRSILTDWQLFFLLLVRAPCGKILRGRLDSLGGSIPPLLRLRATRHCRMTHIRTKPFRSVQFPGLGARAVPLKPITCRVPFLAPHPPARIKPLLKHRPGANKLGASRRRLGPKPQAALVRSLSNEASFEARLS
jgi:hypothetical protein